MLGVLYAAATTPHAEKGREPSEGRHPYLEACLQSSVQGLAASHESWIRSGTRDDFPVRGVLRCCMCANCQVRPQNHLRAIICILRPACMAAAKLASLLLQAFQPSHTLHLPIACAW